MRFAAFGGCSSWIWCEGEGWEEVEEEEGGEIELVFG
jgi:hypothetical protein